MIPDGHGKIVQVNVVGGAWWLVLFADGIMYTARLHQYHDCFSFSDWRRVE